MTLADNIHRLKNEHLSMADGRAVKVPALLDQLESACSSNLGAQGGGSGGKGLLVNTRAVDLHREIRRDALAYHFEMHGYEFRGSLRGLIGSWVAPPTEQWGTFLEHATLDWCDRIGDLLESRRPPFRPSIPCPACGQRFHGDENAPALSIEYWDHEQDKALHPHSWTAECAACGAEWRSYEEMKFLRATTDTPENAGMHS